MKHYLTLIATAILLTACSQVSEDVSDAAAKQVLKVRDKGVQKTQQLQNAINKEASEVEIAQ